MLELTPDGAPKASFEAAGVERALVSGRDVMITSPIAGGDVRVERSEVVFAGYGVVAPEYGWNDYEGIDVRARPSSSSSTIRACAPGTRRSSAAVR